MEVFKKNAPSRGINAGALPANGRIAIIGGGIGGLVTAIALQQRGISTDVYEAAPEIAAVGAGIWMAPNALAVFDRLGMKEAIIAEGYNVKYGSIMDIRGRVIQHYSPEEITQNRYPLVPIRRSTLQQTLIKFLQPETLHLGKRYKSMKRSDNSVSVQFEDGTETDADILIGADGIRSRVRTDIFGEAQYRYSGQTCWRGIVDFELPDSNAACEMWGENAGVRVGYSHVSPRSVYFYATACASAGGVDIRGMVHKRLAELYVDFPPHIRALLASVDESSIIRSDIWDFAPIPSWHSGRVALIGDAAHAATPNLGQGGCQAIEDGFVLAEAITNEASIEEAFQRYEATRMKKARFVVETSHRIGRVVNWGGTKARLRNALAAKSPRNLARGQLQYLFHLNY